MSLTRCIVRWGLIGTLALGGLTLLVGPNRVAAGLAQVRTKAQNVVDRCVDDPVALRRQLEQLSEEYPDRIAEVRGEMAEVDHQLRQFHRDVEIAKRVVAMTTEDLQEMKTLVARAEAESAVGARPVAIRYEGVRFNLEEAYAEGRRINHVRGTYQDRLANDEFQLKFLEEQKGRLADIQEKLEADYSTYQAQLWQLDRQIDAIQRNERLIELTEQQQATLQSFEQFGEVHSLRQLEAKLAELRTKQEAQFAWLSKQSRTHEYEQEAAYDLDTRDVDMNPFDDVNVIEPEPAKPGSVAFAN